MPLPSGTSIGPYEIVGWIGAGGMGEVYRARDPRLGREVAIKVIPERFATDTSRLHRFEQEARAAGQLNHPNILAVYDIGTHDGAPYIVSELLDGESLGSRLNAGAVPSRKAIEWARQTAEGLAAAHDRGIVHRDLKPDNLFITNDGRIKILDFGIAKLMRPGDDADRPTGFPTETAEGMVVGTAGYMSPEQVRGDAVDARSDVFSFGAVLYEMLAGRPAFVRATAPDTMAAILKEDPPDPHSSTVSPALLRIVSRCLEKAREARFQSARDLAFALEVLSGTTGTAATAAAVGKPRHWRTGLGVAVVVLSVVIAVMSWLGRDTAPVLVPVENALFKARFRLITDSVGTEENAEISQDGKFVTFLADGRLLSIQLGGRPQDITPNGWSFGRSGILRHLGYSGDGTEIWVTRGFGADRALSIMHIGDSPRPFLGENAQAPSWSRDLKRLVFFKNGDGDPLFVADGAGNDEHPIPIVPADPKEWDDLPIHNHNPVWATDDQWIYFTRGPMFEFDWTDEMDVWRVRPSGGSPERLTHQNAAVTFIAPLDPQTLLYVARADDGSGPWLWELDVESKITRRVTTGLEQYTTVASSADGSRAVATVANPTSSLWAFPIQEHEVNESDVKPYPVGMARAMAPRFGATETALFFLTSQGTGDELYRLQDPRPTEIRKFTDAALSQPPAVSKDGRRLVLAVRQSGKQHLLIMSSDGTNSTALAPSLETRGTAAWSPDGNWVVIGGRDAQGLGLFKIPVNVAGGVPQRIKSGPALDPVWSPDGNLIVYSGPILAGRSQLLAVRPDSTEVTLEGIKVRSNAYRFLPDGGLVFSAVPGVFEVLDLKTMKKRPLAKFAENRGRNQWFDITPDGKWLVFDRTIENSDIMLIDLFKNIKKK